MNRIAKYLIGEDGAITADWVVLTAGLVGLGAIVYVNFYPAVQHVDNQTGTALNRLEVQEIVLNLNPSD